MRAVVTMFLAMFAAISLAQGPTAGFEILRIKRQSVKVPSGPVTRSGETEPQLDIEFVNTLSTTNTFEVEVIFIGVREGSAPYMFIRKLLRFPVSLAPLERGNISANSIVWYDTHHEHNAVFPVGKNDNNQPKGWIVRAIRDGEVIKLEASGAAMRRLAEPETISALLAGGKIPAK